MLGLVHEDVGCSLGAERADGRITRHGWHASSRRQAASETAKCAVSPCTDAQGLSLTLTLHPQPHPKPGPDQFCAELRAEASTEQRQQLLLQQHRPPS